MEGSNTRSEICVLPLFQPCIFKGSLKTGMLCVTSAFIAFGAYVRHGAPEFFIGIRTRPYPDKVLWLVVFGISDYGDVYA